jgi:hypothetical protein
MLVRIGDGREVECIRYERAPPGPWPEVLASERLATERQAWRVSWLLSAFAPLSRRRREAWKDE